MLYLLLHLNCAATSAPTFRDPGPLREFLCPPCCPIPTRAISLLGPLADKALVEAWGRRMLGIGVVGMARARRVERSRVALLLKVTDLLIMVTMADLTKDDLKTSGLGADVNRYHVELVFVWYTAHGTVLPVSRTVPVGSSWA